MSYHLAGRFLVFQGSPVKQTGLTGELIVKHFRDLFEIDRDKITFHLLKKEPWTAYQVKFVELMLSEIIPAGTAASLSVE